MNTLSVLMIAVPVWSVNLSACAQAKLTTATAAKIKPAAASLDLGVGAFAPDKSKVVEDIGRLALLPADANETADYARRYEKVQEQILKIGSEGLSDIERAKWKALAAPTEKANSLLTQERVAERQRIAAKHQEINESLAAATKRRKVEEEAEAKAKQKTDPNEKYNQYLGDLLRAGDSSEAVRNGIEPMK